MNKWTKKEIQLLIVNYPDKGKVWCIDNLSKTEGSIRAMAAKLKLRQNKDSEFFKSWQNRAAKSKKGKKRPDHSILMKKYAEEGKLITGQPMTIEQKNNISKKAKERIKRQGHPKGFLGYKHSDKSKKIMSEKSKKVWEDDSNYINSEEYRQLLSDRAVENQKTGVFKGGYSRGKQGTYDINGRKVFFRSLWEANYALYLDFLIGQKQIKKWEFEVDTFWFEKIRRGVRSYKPDFKVYENNGSFCYHEVKGWMDAKSKTKLKRMAKYYPKIKMVLIDKKPYKAIIKSLDGVIKFFK